MRLTKRLLSAILVLVMVFSMLPLQAFASEVHTEDGGGMKLPVQGAKPTEAQEEVAARVELNESSAMISVGNTFTFVPTLFSDQGEQMESKMDFKWESSNPEVATVENGAVTGAAEGLATITCSYGNLQTTAIVSVTKATYQLTYEIDYPDDAKKVAYQNGGKATIIKPQDTRITVSCEPGKTVVIPSDLASTINYQLTGFTDGEKQYQVGESIAVSTNMTLKSCWTPIEGAGSEGFYETIYVTYRSNDKNDKRVTKEVKAFVLPDAGNYLKGTATFITANNNDTIATGDRTMCGWTINNVAYGLNQQVTVPVSRGTLVPKWTVDAYARYETVAENEAYAEFFVRKSGKVNEEGFGADKYFSIGSRKIKIDPNWDTSTRIDGAEVAKYLLDPPTAEEVANLMNESLPAGAVVDWNHLSKLDTGFHVDGVIRTAGKYWNVKFIDPDNNRCVQQVLVLDEDKISTIYDGNRLNTNVRTFIGWSFQPDGKPIDNLSEKTVNGDITLYALFDRKPAYTVRAKLYVVTPNGKAELLTEKVETDLTLDRLKAMYNQSCSELATHFWKGVGQSGMHGTARWTPEGSADPNRQSPKEHIVELYLKEGDVQNVSVTLTYDGNGEEVTGVPGVVKTIKGESVQISSTTPTRPGYTFKGWNTEENGAGNQYGGENGATTITLDQSTTLYAQWEAKTATYTVKHYLEGEAVGDYSGEAATVEGPFTESIGKSINPESMAKSNDFPGYELDTVKTEDTFTIGPNPADNVIEVYYKRSAYTVTYQVDGEQYERPYTVRYGTKHDLIPEPTETGHSFSGWRVISDGVTIQTGEDGKSYITMPAGNVTIEGSFTKLTNLSYTVNYYWNGDHNTPIYKSETVGNQIFDATVTLDNDNLPKIPGYTLIDATYDVEIGADSSKNITNVYYRKNVTVTANSITNHKFGSEIPQLTARVLPAGVKLTMVYQLKTDADKGSPVGSYPIYFVDDAGKPINHEVEGNREPVTVTEDNYLVTFNPGTLTITEADGLSISAEGGTWDYDGEFHGDVEVNVNLPGAKLTYSTDGVHYAEDVPTIRDVSESGKTFYVKASLANYVEKTATYTLTVNPRAVTITAPQNVTGVYGQAMPVLAPTVAPTVQELPDDFYETVDYDMVCEATSTSPVVEGGYPIYFTRDGQTVEGLVKYGNYDVTFVPSKLIITKADGLDLSITDYSNAYDGQPHTGRVTSTTAGTTIEYLVDGEWTETAPTITDVGTETYTVRATNPNYQEVKGQMTVTVNKRLVTVTSASSEKVYDGTPLTAGMEPETGWVGEEGAEYTFHASVTDVTTGEGVPNTFSYEAKEGTNLDNYLIKMVNGSLKVNPKPIKVKADDKGMTYGGDVPALTAQLAEGSALADVDAGKLLAEVIGGYTMNVQYKDGEPNVGEHPIVFVDENGVRGNYDVTFVSGTLTIQPAESLSVQPFSYEGIYDGQSHGGEATVFVNGEKFTDATVSYYVSDSMDGPWEKQNSYPTIQNVGEFYVMVVAEHNNYNTAVEYAHLRVIPRTVTVTAENAEKVYGDVDPTSFAAQVDGLLGGDTIDYQVARAEGEDADKYDITPTGEQNQGNYVVQYYSGEFTINPKPIKVKADDKGMTYGGDVPALTAQLEEGSALADRDAEKTLEAVIGKYTLEVQLPQDRPLVGRHTIDFTDEDGVRGNYLVTFVPGELTIEAPTSGEGTGIVTKTHENKTYNPGEWVRFTISATNIYNQPATLTIVEQLENVVFEQVENVTMAPGETLTFEAQYQVTEADILRGSLSNTIDWTIAPNEGSSIGGTVTDPVDLAGRNSAMTVEKTIEDQKDSYRVGDVISFQILVKNTGNVTLHNLELTDRLINANGRVTFTETNGASLSGGKLLLAQLAPGQQWTVKCSYTVTEADAGKNIGNAATVTPEDGPTITDETDEPAPVEQRHTLTIRYLNTAGVSIHEDYTGRYHAGDRYEIASPAVAGYTLTADSVVRSGVMGEGDKTLVVVYDRVPTPAPDPDPEPDPNPAPDPDPAPNPDPDAPAPDPDPDPEADPAQQTEPQDNTEPVLQPGTYLEDPEDHTLTPIDEEETPLANVNLNGHTCCILHFLLMLAAVVVYGFDTKSRKKHQARIFELKRQLAMKDDQNDSQQS